MRIGKLIINYPNAFINGSMLFNTDKKEPETITDINSQFSKYSFAELLVEDQITGERFPMKHFQWAYIFKSENKDNFKFFTTRENNIDVATIISKDIFTLDMVNYFTPIANAYGQYVAGQKEIKEPIKMFSDWYFHISV